LEVGGERVLALLLEATDQVVEESPAFFEAEGR
jgi:hypothetical protein